MTTATYKRNTFIWLLISQGWSPWWWSKGIAKSSHLAPHHRAERKTERDRNRDRECHFLPGPHICSISVLWVCVVKVFLMWLPGCYWNWADKCWLHLSPETKQPLRLRGSNTQSCRHTWQSSNSQTSTQYKSHTVTFLLFTHWWQ